MKADLKEDIDLLLECLKCQLDNPLALRPALLTLTSICSSSQDLAQDYLRGCGGLQFIVELLTSTSCADVKQAALYALGCAIEENVHSQTALSYNSLFVFLASTLSSTLSSPISCGQAVNSSSKTCHTAVFLIISLVANNGRGQFLAKSSGCLENLLNIFREFLQLLSDASTLHNKELFAATSSALCVCVNNPQNDENQRAVATVFPLAFQYLQRPLDPTFVKSVTSFLGLAIANNVHNQQRVVPCGGLEALVGALHRVVNRCHGHRAADVDDGDNTAAALALVSTLDTVIADSGGNALTCGRLGIIPLLVKLLEIPHLQSASLAKITLTLGHCIENCNENLMLLVKHGGMGVLVQQLGRSDSEDYIPFVKYVLQQCVQSNDESMKLATEASCTASSMDVSLTQQLLPNDKIHQKIVELEAKLDEVNKPKPARFPSPILVKSPSLTTPTEEETSLELFAREKPKQLLSFKRRNLLKEKHNIFSTESSEDVEEKKEKVCAAKMQKLSTAELDKIQNQLQEIEQDKHKEVQVLRAAMTRRVAEKQAAANKAQLLTEELERQHQEQTDTTGRAQQLEKSKEQHKQLLQLKESKQREMQREIQDLEQMLSKVQTDLMASSHLLSPASLCSLSTHITKPQHSIHQYLHKSTPLSSARIDTRKQASAAVGTPQEISPTALASAQKTKAQSVKVTKKLFANDFDQNNQNNYVGKTRKEQEVPKLDTPIVIASSKPTANDVFVKPFAPVKCRRATTSSSAQSANTPLPKTHKRQLFTPGGQQRRSMADAAANIATKTALNAAQTSEFLQSVAPQITDESDAMSGIYCHASPASTVHSEFDAGLLKQASTATVPSSSLTTTDQQYWTRKRITNYVTSCPTAPGSSSSTSSCKDARTPLIVKCVSCFKAIKKNCVIPSRRGGGGGGGGASSSARKSRSVASSHVSIARADTRQQTVRESGSHMVIQVPVPICGVSSPANIEGRKRRNACNRECPGCRPPCVLSGGQLLNSRTFNIALESSHGTCALHRKMRIEERNFIKQQRQNFASPRPKKRILLKNVTLSKSKSKPGISVYDFTSSVDDKGSRNKLTKHILTPGVTDSTSFVVLTPTRTATSSVRSHRRARVPYSQQEELNLVDGVHNMGKFWSQILHTYQFHALRTAIDLKDKYRSMMKKSQGDIAVRSSPPRRNLAFSMAEDRRLRRGVRQFGYSWTTILKGFNFAPSRTAVELRQRWRALHKLKPTDDH